MHPCQTPDTPLLACCKSKCAAPCPTAYAPDSWNVPQMHARGKSTSLGDEHPARHMLRTSLVAWPQRGHAHERLARLGGLAASAAAAAAAPSSVARPCLTNCFSNSLSCKRAAL